MSPLIGTVCRMFPPAPPQAFGRSPTRTTERWGLSVVGRRPPPPAPHRSRRYPWSVHDQRRKGVWRAQPPALFPIIHLQNIPYTVPAPYPAPVFRATIVSCCGTSRVICMKCFIENQMLRPVPVYSSRRSQTILPLTPSLML
jgi:hypothetical protein